MISLFFRGKNAAPWVRVIKIDAIILILRIYYKEIVKKSYKQEDIYCIVLIGKR